MYILYIYIHLYILHLLLLGPRWQQPTPLEFGVSDRISSSIYCISFIIIRSMVSSFHLPVLFHYRCDALVGCYLRDVSYYCDCTETGYEGNNCQTDYDECAENTHQCKHESRFVPTLHTKSNHQHSFSPFFSLLEVAHFEANFAIYCICYGGGIAM